MKIGFLGAGSVAQALSRAFIAAGHDVCVSSRDPGSAKLAGWLAEVGLTQYCVGGLALVPAAASADPIASLDQACQ